MYSVLLLMKTTSQKNCGIVRMTAITVIQLMYTKRKIGICMGENKDAFNTFWRN